MNLTDEAVKPPPGCHYRFVPGWGRGTFANPWCQPAPGQKRAKTSRTRAEIEALIHDLETQLESLQ